VAEPFAAIEIGVDKRSLIASRIRSILLRSDAIDASAELNSRAAFSANSLLWQRDLLEQICL